MIFEALIAAAAITLISLVGVLFFGHDKHLVGLERFVVPVAVGVFLSLVLYELIPETLAESPNFGGIVVAVGFILFYILSNILHKKFHDQEAENCDRKGAATLLLIGDSVHNLADGFILGGAFLIDPTVGIAVAFGLALHEIPQEIVEFGVLIRAGYTRAQAALRNLLSASSVIVGTLLIMIIAEQAHEYVWILTGFAAGNLLFLAASDLLPRIHGNLKNYGNIWHTSIAIIIGFSVMTGVITWTHSAFGDGHIDEEERGH
jgi:zinc and cadmium transporter